jgi:HEAT repeat protein
MRRMFLCRALGLFTVTEGLDVLLRAASEQRDPVEVEVRYAGLEAIATLADNCGPATFENDDRVLNVVFAAADAEDATSAPAPPPNEDGSPTLYRPHAELRAVAAYALGVIGGERCHEKLKVMLHDPYPNARYNAATGLARVGDAECERILKEMLDPDNEVAVRDEKYKDNQELKRKTVLLNGIKGTLLLAERNPEADLARLKDSLHQLTQSPLTNVLIDRNKVKRAAAEALERLEK